MHPAWVKAERLSWWIFDAVVLIPGAVGILAFAIKGWSFWPETVLSLIWFALAVVLIWSTIAYPRAVHRHAAIGVGELGVEYRRGVWWRKTTIIPRSRVQHTDVSQGPLMRRFGLGKLVIHTAGTRNAIVEVQGLAFEDANMIRDRLHGRVHEPTGAGSGTPDTPAAVGDDAPSQPTGDAPRGWSGSPREDDGV